MDLTTYISGPAPHLDLAYSDVWLPGLYSRRILCFEMLPESSHKKAIDVLKRALQSLVDGTPELGGQVVVLPAEEANKVPWKGIRPYKGIEFVVKDLMQQFPSYKQLEERRFPMCEFKDDLLVPVPLAIRPEPNAEMVVQATLIDGGLLLTICLCHQLTDGNGMNAIMAALGEQCILAGEMSGPLPPRKMNVDRKLMLAFGGSRTDLKDHPAYGRKKGAFLPHTGSHSTVNNGLSETQCPEQQLENEDAAENGTVASKSPKVEIHSFRISAGKISALKESSTISRISTHDAVAALMWRTIIIARHKAGHLRENQMCTYSFPHNARRYVGLPKDWVGNCCYMIIVSLPVSEIIAPNSLPTIASSIRAALNAVGKDVVGGLMELRKACTYDITWWPFFEYSEPWIWMMTSFYHSELYGTDWGDAIGRVKHFTSSDEGALGEFKSTGYVGPKLPDEGCDVSLGLSREEYEFVKADQVWREYTKELGK